jgi:hypothetical protein
MAVDAGFSPNIIARLLKPPAGLVITSPADGAHALDGRNNAMRQPKEYRRPTKLQAMIHPGDGKAPIECSVVEIAERTALLSVSDADAVPISFVLTFAGGTQVHRHCTVLSRQPGQIVVLMLKSEP